MPRKNTFFKYSNILSLQKSIIGQKRVWMQNFAFKAHFSEKITQKYLLEIKLEPSTF